MQASSRSKCGPGSTGKCWELTDGTICTFSGTVILCYYFHYFQSLRMKAVDSTSTETLLLDEKLSHAIHILLLEALLSAVLISIISMFFTIVLKIYTIIHIISNLRVSIHCTGRQQHSWVQKQLHIILLYPLSKGPGQGISLESQLVRSSWCRQAMCQGETDHPGRQYSFWFRLSWPAVALGLQYPIQRGVDDFIQHIRIPTQTVLRQSQTGPHDDSAAWHR